MTWTATGPAELHRFRPAASTPSAVPLAPARVLDTRATVQTVDGVSQGGGRAAAGSVTKVRVAGRGSVPPDAAAAIVNLTVVAPDGPGSVARRGVALPRAWHRSQQYVGTR